MVISPQPAVLREMHRGAHRRRGRMPQRATGAMGDEGSDSEGKKMSGRAARLF
jgi:hypothetical protein